MQPSFPTKINGLINSRPWSREIPRIGLQKAPGQDLAQDGRFGSFPY